LLEPLLDVVETVVDAAKRSSMSASRLTRSRVVATSAQPTEVLGREAATTLIEHLPPRRAQTRPLPKATGPVWRTRVRGGKVDRRVTT